MIDSTFSAYRSRKLKRIPISAELFSDLLISPTRIDDASGKLRAVITDLPYDLKIVGAHWSAEIWGLELMCHSDSFAPVKEAEPVPVFQANARSEWLDPGDVGATWWRFERFERCVPLFACSIVLFCSSESRRRSWRLAFKIGRKTFDVPIWPYRSRGIAAAGKPA